ncbi:hypothetical protein [Nonomuraea sp. NPDC049607]
MTPPTVTCPQDLVDLSVLAPARLEGLGNSVIAMELLELLASAPEEDDLFAVFDTGTPAPRRAGGR